MAAQFVHTDGESYTSATRKAWLKRSIGPSSLPLLDRYSRVFLRQSLSPPCVTTVAMAEGIRIAKWCGGRCMEFSGNSVHQIGHGRLRLSDHQGTTLS